MSWFNLALIRGVNGALKTQIGAFANLLTATGEY
jgi:hypothetical protein